MQELGTYRRGKAEHILNMRGSVRGLIEQRIDREGEATAASLQAALARRTDLVTTVNILDSEEFTAGLHPGHSRPNPIAALSAALRIQREQCLDVRNAEAVRPGYEDLERWSGKAIHRPLSPATCHHTSRQPAPPVQ